MTRNISLKEAHSLLYTIAEIAEIAHRGGLQNLSEAEALIKIRRLTIPWQQKRSTQEKLT